MIPLLTTPSSERDFVFEVVCPSIPGYGFSEAPHQKLVLKTSTNYLNIIVKRSLGIMGWMGACFDARSAARLFVILMERLGHDRFYVQGGDWGSLVSTLLGKYYPNK
ncbi:epoxide hydrolase [Caerostris extrusa]|uniref:Epoxide hydrolase n=1 Tax=Caerostris extrusa TaxID=172846 RepID=A0AAV4UC39_CAEEX|nr:epoxide hydrolase [Caerostris extrusa]